MKRWSELNPEERASIGVGFAVGGILGAFMMEYIYHKGLLTLLGSFLGMILGATIGSRLLSEAFQFIWIEYSARVSRRFTIPMLLFAAFILVSFSTLSPTLAPALIILLIGATLGSLMLSLISIRSTIAQLDDVLREVQLNAIAIAFVITLFMAIVLALIDMVYPIPSNWLVMFIIMLTAFLNGRFISAWKYR